MSLPGKVENAAPPVPGFDCDRTVSAVLAQQLYEQGYKFCLRYLSRGPNLLTTGRWSPTEALGQDDGQGRSRECQKYRFPGGVNVRCDLEEVSKSAQPQDVIDYCKGTPGVAL